MVSSEATTTVAPSIGWMAHSLHRRGRRPATPSIRHPGIPSVTANNYSIIAVDKSAASLTPNTFRPSFATLTANYRSSGANDFATTSITTYAANACVPEVS